MNIQTPHLGLNSLAPRWNLGVGSVKACVPLAGQLFVNIFVLVISLNSHIFADVQSNTTSAVQHGCINVQWKTPLYRVTLLRSKL